jgi:hypothetical protein
VITATREKTRENSEPEREKKDVASTALRKKKNDDTPLGNSE